MTLDDVECDVCIMRIGTTFVSKGSGNGHRPKRPKPCRQEGRTKAYRTLDEETSDVRPMGLSVQVDEEDHRDWGRLAWS